MSESDKRVVNYKNGARIIPTFLTLVTLCFISAQSASAAKTLKRETLDVPATGEVGLEIEARAPGASWERPQAEAAALRVTIDGQYQQDLTLFGGEQAMNYRISLGNLEKGKHQLEIALNPDRSAPRTQDAEVLNLHAIFPVSDTKAYSEEDLNALRYSPVLFARANSIDRFTDIPLLMYYEIEHPAAERTLIRYTVIFTNEDGGTPSAALMARWGRATDIEWVYQVVLEGGRIVEETYQGVDHETKPFKGQRTMGTHPLLADASDNNNFSDQACSSVRVALFPQKADMTKASRESVMDMAPWTYRIMAEELVRERRITSDPREVSQIADPRDYLYIEASSEQQGTSVAFDATLNDGKVITSDFGDARLRIDRSGIFRSAIRLPHGTPADGISQVAMRCTPTSKPSETRACKNASVRKVLMLDENYNPHVIGLKRAEAKDLRAGETAVYGRE
jgi:hypothetical protein